MKRGTHVFLIHKKNLIELSAKIKHLCEKTKFCVGRGFWGNI